MVAVFHAWPNIEELHRKSTTSGEKSLIHQIKAPIFPDTVFAIETTYEAQFYFSMEDKPEIDN